VERERKGEDKRNPGGRFGKPGIDAEDCKQIGSEEPNKREDSSPSHSRDDETASPNLLCRIRSPGAKGARGKDLNTEKQSNPTMKSRPIESPAEPKMGELVGSELAYDDCVDNPQAHDPQSPERHGDRKAYELTYESHAQTDGG
jgi:hypothetical protein